MEHSVITKSIRVSASNTVVWDVLTNPPLVREWASTFSAGSSMEADWRVGGRVVCKDTGGYGLAGTVTEYTPSSFSKYNTILC